MLNLSFKKYNLISFNYPKVTNLPKHRVNFVRPFILAGIDFTEHLWIEDDNEMKKNVHSNFYPF